MVTVEAQERGSRHDGNPSATPVFVDPTGRRAKALRVFGSAAALTALGFLVAVAVVLTARPEPPHPIAGTELGTHANTAAQARPATTAPTAR